MAISCQPTTLVSPCGVRSFAFRKVAPAAIGILRRDNEVDGLLGRDPQFLIARHEECFTQNDGSLPLGVHTRVLTGAASHVTVSTLVLD